MNNSENIDTFEEHSYEPEEITFKFKSLISDKILGCRSIISIFSKLGMELNHYTNKKRKILKNSKLSINMHDL